MKSDIPLARRAQAGGASLIVLLEMGLELLPKADEKASEGEVELAHTLRRALDMAIRLKFESLLESEIGASSS
jgi:hypothetical protein